MLGRQSSYIVCTCRNAITNRYVHIGGRRLHSSHFRSNCVRLGSIGSRNRKVTQSRGAQRRRTLRRRRAESQRSPPRSASQRRSRWRSISRKPRAVRAESWAHRIRPAHAGTSAVQATTRSSISRSFLLLPRFRLPPTDLHRQSPCSVPAR